MEKELCALLEDSELGDIDYVDLGDIETLEVAPDDVTTTNTKSTMVQNALGSIAMFVDIVFCIDVTQSMAPIIDAVKKLTLDLSENLITDMREKTNRIIKQLRVKVISFRDYYCDGSRAMEESQFLTLPEQNKEFRNLVAALEVGGGGDGPKSALEAMALAMKSDWVKISNPVTESARHIVYIFTDSSAYPLEKAEGYATEDYPLDMLKSYSELYYAWNPTGYPLGNNYVNPYDMDMRARRLLIFAPEDVYPWCEIAEEFEYTALLPISALNNGVEVIEQAIL